MNSRTRALVEKRADGRCEYCRLRREDSHFRFHVDHAVPRQHGGSDSLENLVLSCRRCNLHKGPNLTGIDPKTGKITALFNPRTQQWHDHFAVAVERIIGLTSEGRTTVRLLKMNDDPRTDLRLNLI